MAAKIDKDTLKSPDMFVSTSDKVFNYISPYFKIIATVGVAALIGSLAYVGWGYYNARKESQASEALYAPEAELKKAESKVREAQAKQMKDLLGDKKAKAPPAPKADYNADYAPIVEKVKGALKAHADSKAALVAALNLSYFLAQQKQFPQALEVLDIPKYRPGSKELLGGFFLMHRGYTQIENNQVDQAIATYQSVVSSDGLKLFHAEALLKLGLAYELKGEAAKARDSYDKVTKQFPDTEAANTAHQYLRLLALNSNKQG